MGDSAFYNPLPTGGVDAPPGRARLPQDGPRCSPWRHDSALIGKRPGARYALAGLCRGEDCSALLVTLGTALDGCVGR